MVTIPKDEYNKLINENRVLITENERLSKIEEKLEALEAVGVDNWDGYGIAMEYLETGEISV